MSFVVALQIFGVVLLLAGLGVWLARPALKPVALWVMVAGVTVLLLAIWVRMQSPAASSSRIAPAAVGDARPIVRVSVETAGNLTQGTDGNYFLSVRLTLANTGSAPGDAIANIVPIPETDLSKDELRRKLLAIRKAGTRRGNAVFAGQPDPGAIEEVPIPAGSVKVTEIKERGIYSVHLPPLLIVATYQPLIKGRIFQTSYVVRPSGQALLPVATNNVLLAGADVRFDRVPGFDTDE
jgi:hypothetical protein